MIECRKESLQAITERTNMNTLNNQTQKTGQDVIQDFMRDLQKLSGFIGENQLRAMADCCKSVGKRFFEDFFRDRLGKLAWFVTMMPATSETYEHGDEAVAWLHYFTDGADWFITHRDFEVRQLQAFGKADLFGDGGGELGCISIEELLAIGAEIDLHWTPKKLVEI